MSADVARDDTVGNDELCAGIALELGGGFNVLLSAT
jgi:hypothetical protein